MIQNPQENNSIANCSLTLKLTYFLLLYHSIQNEINRQAEKKWNS